MQITGQCHCGAIAYAAEVEPGTVVLCHCHDCQTFSGAPYRAMVRPVPDTLVLTGEPVHYAKVAQSGNVRLQGFCGACGTHLYARNQDGSALGLRIGAIAQRAQLGAPMRQVWCESALPWTFALPEDGRLDQQG